MLKSNLHPPRDGLDADPILYGVAAGLAELFPPVELPPQQGVPSRREREGGRERPRETATQE